MGGPYDRFSEIGTRSPPQKMDKLRDRDVRQPAYFAFVSVLLRGGRFLTARILGTRAVAADAGHTETDRPPERGDRPMMP